MFKVKIVGEVKVYANIDRNDWQWRRSTPEYTLFIGVRKDVEAGSYDVVVAGVNRFNSTPDFRTDSEEDKVYDTYAEALNAARRITAQLEIEATEGV
jgi:hypothetical protein